MSKKKLRLEILDRMSTLATAGFGLVAALAWNSAIQDLFKKVNFFGTVDGLLSKFFYALIVTVITVIIAYSLSRAVNNLKDELGINKEEKEK